MAVVFHRNEVKFERRGEIVNIPNNDVAHLMYYWSCVCFAIDSNHDQVIQRFIDYRNWVSLSFQEQRELLVVCYAFSPDVLDNRVFFHSEALCGNYNNAFFTINQVRSQLLAAESIVIAGQIREVNKIMTYTMPWMKTYYFEPMQRLVSKLNTPPQTITHTPNYTPSVIRQPTKKTSSWKCNRTRICWCIYCFFCVIPGIIGIIITIVNANKK